MMSKQTNAFTLLEIILVITILSMVASVVGWQIATCVNRYALQREVEEVYNAVKQSQVLSLTYKTDIGVHFLREDGVFYYCLQTDEPFMEISFDREKKALRKVGRITFNGKSVKTFDLSLFSNGNIEPRGVLGFFPQSKKNDTALWFDFQCAHLLSISHIKPSNLKERSPSFPEDKLKKLHVKKQEDKPVLDVPDAVKK
jgi:prepilin-type N-terminal cleavage/methylation domain-containing protein